MPEQGGGPGGPNTGGDTMVTVVKVLIGIVIFVVLCVVAFYVFGADSLRMKD
jgi:hypothetical protein